MGLLRTLAFGAAGYGALALLGRTLTQRRENLSLGEAPLPGRLTNVDGVDLHYLEDGAGPPALLIHGLGGNTFSFRETIPALAPRFRTVAVDLPGSGYSDRTPEHDYSLDGHARLLARFMDQQGLKPALVLGHSMGGGVAMRLAALYPDYVDRLLLVASMRPNDLRRGGPLRHLLRPFFPLLGVAQAVVGPVSRTMMRRMVYDPAFVTPAVLAGYQGPRSLRGSSAALRRQLTDTARDVPIDPRTLRVPTLLLWGEADRVAPLSTGEALLEQIPEARLEVIPRAGHLLLEEQPSAANAALLRWLEETEAVRRGGTAPA